MASFTFLPSSQFNKHPIFLFISVSTKVENGTKKKYSRKQMTVLAFQTTVLLQKDTISRLCLNNLIHMSNEVLFISYDTVFKIHISEY